MTEGCSAGWPARTLAPGASVLGGAASGLSYEGVLRDALAREGRMNDRLVQKLWPAPARALRPPPLRPPAREVSGAA
jgi:hypothetical protein